MDKYQTANEINSCDNEKKSSELGYKPNYLNGESKILNSDETTIKSDNKSTAPYCTVPSTALCNESNKTMKHNELDNSYDGKKFVCLKNDENRPHRVEYDNIDRVPPASLSVEAGAGTSRYILYCLSKK